MVVPPGSWGVVTRAAAARGARITVETEGADAEAALEAIAALVADRFGEEV